MDSKKSPFTEDMLPLPQDPYGIAKLASEETLKVLSEVHNFDFKFSTSQYYWT